MKSRFLAYIATIKNSEQKILYMMVPMPLLVIMSSHLENDYYNFKNIDETEQNKLISEVSLIAEQLKNCNKDISNVSFQQYREMKEIVTIEYLAKNIISKNKSFKKIKNTI